MLIKLYLKDVTYPVILLIWISVFIYNLEKKKKNYQAWGFHIKSDWLKRILSSHNEVMLLQALLCPGKTN